MIKLENVIKKFGNQTAVDNLSLEIKKRRDMRICR